MASKGNASGRKSLLAASVKEEGTSVPPGQFTIEEIDRILFTIPERQRSMFLLNRVDRLTYAQIAERYGVTPREVERAMVLVLLRLRYAQSGWRRPWWRRLLDRFSWTSPGVLPGERR